MHTTATNSVIKNEDNIFVDVHTHILPAVDDGSKDLEESIAMLLEERRQADELFGKDSRCVIVLTPHFKSYNQTIEQFLINRASAYASLRNAIEEHENPEVRDLADRVEFVLGAEILVHSELEEVEGLDKLLLGNSQFFLFEFSEEYFSSSYIQVMERVCYKYKATPVLAHFERYASFMQYDDYQALMTLKNIIFQFNARSMSAKSKKGFGSRRIGDAARLVLKFLNYDVPMVMGSDCHGILLREPNCIRGYANAQRFMKAEEYLAFMTTLKEFAIAVTE